MNEQEVAELRSRLAAAEKAREEAERERDEARRCLNAIPNGHPGCAKDHSARLAEWLECWICKEEAAESRAARLAKAGAEFASQYGARAFDCRYDNSCDDSGREPRCEPCELRAAIAAEGGK